MCAGGQGCRDYFGVHSYLHHFYETRGGFKDPDLYEDDSGRRLLGPSQGGRGSCGPRWWKGMALLGTGSVKLDVLVDQKFRMKSKMLTNKLSPLFSSRHA
jgi:hypothetical protein